MLAVIEKLDPDIIASFRKTGTSAAIPEHVQDYIRHMDRASELYAVFTNISSCARALQRHFPSAKLSFNAARERIYSAIEHFHLNANVSAAAWDQFYADRMDSLAQLAVACDDLQTAQRCMEKAHTYRTFRKDDVIDPELLKPPTIIYSMDLSAEALGFEKKSMKDIARKYEDGKFTELIDKLPIPDEDKERLRSDANISDAQIIEDNE